jgi:hypothetical protein
MDGSAQEQRASSGSRSQAQGQKVTLGLEGLGLGLLDPAGRGASSFGWNGRRAGCAIASGKVCLVYLSTWLVHSDPILRSFLSGEYNLHIIQSAVTAPAEGFLQPRILREEARIRHPEGAQTLPFHSQEIPTLASGLDKETRNPMH